MTDKPAERQPQDPDQQELELERSPFNLFVPIRAWQYDSVSTVVLNVGTLVLVAGLYWVLELVLALTGITWAVWTVRFAMGVSVGLTLVVGVVSDTVRFMLRRWREFREEWKDDHADAE